MRQRKQGLLLFCVLLVLYAGNAVVNAFETEDSIPIIGYHHIVPDADKKAYFATNMWVVSLSDFEQQMKLLQEKGYHSITLMMCMRGSRARKSWMRKVLLSPLMMAFIPQRNLRSQY